MPIFGGFEAILIPFTIRLFIFGLNINCDNEKIVFSFINPFFIESVWSE